MSGRRRSLPLDRPFELHQPLLYLLGATSRYPGGLRLVDGALRAVRTPEGPSTYALRKAGGALELEAWGEGAEWVLDRLPGCAGYEDRPPELAEPVGALARRHRGVRMIRALDPVEFLMEHVIRQRVSGRDAGRSRALLMRRFGEPAPGPGGLRLPLSDEQWRGLGTLELAEAGVELRRARTLQEVAGRLERIRAWMGEPPAEVARRLQRIRGIGPWTATMVQAWGLGDEDAVPLGDFGQPGLVGWALAGERDADDRRMLELLEPYRPHRFRVILLLAAADRYPPRRGHRIAGPRPGPE